MGETEKPALVYRFPEGCGETTLAELQERIRKGQSLRIAVAHQVQQESLLLQNALLAVKDKPEDFSLKEMVVDEYTLVGSLILEVDDYLWRGFEPEGTLRYKQIELLKEDSSGFALLDWWFNWRPRKFQRLTEEKKKAVLAGRAQGVRRYKEWYAALQSRVG